MLILSRTVGQKIDIGGGIVITVTRIGGNRVGLGIEAPRSVRIHRSELPVVDEPAGPPPGFKPKGKPRKGGVGEEASANA